MRFSVAALAALTSLPTGLAAQQPAPTETTTVVEGVDFRVFDREGQSRSFADVFVALDRADVVLVGESHDDQVGHGVEAELLVRAAERIGAVGRGGGRPLVLSLEMFERDVQLVVDEYLAGLVTEEQFKRSARPWERYDTDYRPMVEFARAHGLPVVAANAPRRYVNRVSRLGPGALDALAPEAKAHLPPLPYPGPSAAYTAQWNEVMAEMRAAMASSGQTPPAEAAPPPSHGIGNALYAQALWDAAMGHAIATALDAHPGAMVIHYAGAFHVERGTGIPESISSYRPATRVLTVVLRPASDVGAWDDEEHRDLADFVILTLRPRDAEVGGPGGAGSDL